MHVHLKYFCGEGAQRTEAQSRTRRNTDRDSNTQRNNDGSSGKTNKKKKLEKKRVTKTIKKCRFKAKDDEDYDSESDLSVQSDQDVVKKDQTRTPRVAASKAKSRVTAAARKERKLAMVVDSSEEEEYVFGSDEDDVNSSEEDTAVVRAKERQAKAFANASKRNRKGKTSKKKSFSESKRNNKSVKNWKKNKGGKGQPDPSSSDEDDSIQGGDLPDIDMSELIAEAMVGCQLSVLHSVCWWRVVLGEQC